MGSQNTQRLALVRAVCCYITGSLRNGGVSSKVKVVNTAVVRKLSSRQELPLLMSVDLPFKPE